jgi:HSP20 family protein
MFYDVFGPSWSPFSELERMLDRVGRLSAGRGRGETTPLNVWANDEALVVTADVPGLDPASIAISIVGDTLSVAGTRQLEQPKDAAWHRRERGAYAVNRTIQLPFRVDPERTEAQVKDGVLTIALRRVESDKPRRIDVRAA